MRYGRQYEDVYWVLILIGIFLFLVKVTGISGVPPILYVIGIVWWLVSEFRGKKK